jgi:serine/threonine protein kinase/tetratricopeptide (TPR) repeat protein
MPPPEWQQIETAFAAALEVPPEGRRAWLDEHYGADAELRREVESLLSAESESEKFLRHDSLAGLAGSLLVGGETDAPGGVRRVGAYTILGELGRGGMGVVYLAAREDGEFTQRVAVKLIRRGLDTEDIIGRFRNERQILASLNHPNIARLLDGGTTEDGVPFFVMEYVEGLPLLRYCDERGLPTDGRLRLFREVCAAVSHAHQNLVIHRDLKPSNILVAAGGEVKLLDFGVAKLLSPEAPGDGAPRTQTNLRVLTPEYASPEQVRGERLTTATDVYSLGVVLYEMLTGAKPYRLKDDSLEELSRAVREDEPSKPSEAFRDSATRRRGDARESPSPSHDPASPRPRVPASQLRGDLDNIVLMALRKEPARRYESVAQFSEDIERHLAGLPVIARQDTFAYRASKFVGRHRVGVAAAALIVLAVLAGLIATVWQARRAHIERDRAQAAQAKAERVSEFLSAALAYSDPAAAVAGAKNRRDATINQMLDDVAPRVETELADQPDIRASLQRTVGMAYLSQLRLAEAERYLNAALETQIKLYGENHQEVAYTLAGLAELQGGKGDYAAAEKSLEKVVAIYRSHQPTEQVHIKAFAGALDTLGDLHWTRGNFGAAESAYGESLALASRLQSADRELAADAKRGLGTTLYAQGRLDESASLLREAVGEYRSLPGARLKLPYALNSLAQVLIWKNEFDEALTDLRESEKIALEVWGESNGDYPRSLWLEVYALCFKGDCAAAAKPLDKAEEVYNRNFPDNKAAKGNLYDARNLILTRTGRAPEGERFGRQAVEFYQSSMERGAPSITLARIHLGESLTAQKKYDEAERVLLEAYKDASEVQGAQHWRTKTAASALVKFYEACNKPDLAAKYRPAPRG